MTSRRTLLTAVARTRRSQDPLAAPAPLTRVLKWPLRWPLRWPLKQTPSAWGLAALAVLLVSPLSASPFSQEATQEPVEAQPQPASLLVVDGAGIPVPGVELHFIERLPGTSVSARLSGGERSDPRGMITWEPGAAPEALDITCPDPDWTVAYVHAERRLEDGPEDIERLATIDLRQLAVCVLHETGTVEIEVVGAQPEELFHATWTDARPEPASHRKAQASVSFVGSRGRLRAPAGRGTLYLTRDGFLGAATLRNGSPLLVSVTAGETSTARVRIEAGPETLFLAPFDTIQFQRLQALAPDGKTVVADLDFESSPLRVPSVIPVSVTGDRDDRPGARPRLPKHLMRAVDAPTSLASLGSKPDPAASPRPGVERAPVLVVFPVDLGGKLRFPEVEQGWIRLALQGNLFLTSQPFAVQPGGAPLRSKPGVARLDRVYAGAPGPIGDPQSPWQLEVTTQDGEPASFREVLVVGAPLPAFRALTDEAGRLEIRGALGPAVEVMALENLGDRLTSTPKAHGTTRPVPRPVLVLSGATGTVRGTWKSRAAEGRILTLIPGDEERKRRGAAGTRATSLCFPDASGDFNFGLTPAGDYELRLEGASLGTVEVRAGETTTLRLEGDGQGVKITR